MNCTYEEFSIHINDACSIARQCDYSYFNFYEINFCYFGNRLYYTLPILLLSVYICFYILSDTSNRYLSPALTILTEKLKISQNLAGITFLALGNGAPDVISSFVGSDTDEGIVFSVGSLTGAGVFVTGIVLSSVVYYSKSVNVNKYLFFRDLILYMILIIILIIIQQIIMNLD